MALAPILDIENEVKPWFAIACCDADQRVLTMLRQFTESQARAFVGHPISQNTITDEYQRREDIGGGYDGPPEYQDIVGDTVYMGRGSQDNAGHLLQLDNGFVRSITEIREDPDARFGQASSAFAASTALTAGTNYFLELDRSGLSRSGVVHRVNGQWSIAPGTIRITYVAGLTKAELADEWAYVKSALLEDMQVKFMSLRSQRSAGGGPLKKESYAGDVTYEYAVSAGGGSICELSEGARAKLQPIRSLRL